MRRDVRQAFPSALCETVEQLPLLRIHAWLPRGGNWELRALRLLARSGTTRWLLSNGHTHATTDDREYPAISLVGETHLGDPRAWVVQCRIMIDGPTDVRAGPAWHDAMKHSGFQIEQGHVDELARRVAMLNSDGSLPRASLSVKDDRVFKFERAITSASLDSIVDLADASIRMGLELTISNHGCLTWARARPVVPPSALVRTVAV